MVCVDDDSEALAIDYSTFSCNNRKYYIKRGCTTSDGVDDPISERDAANPSILAGGKRDINIYIDDSYL